MNNPTILIGVMPEPWWVPFWPEKPEHIDMPLGIVPVRVQTHQISNTEEIVYHEGSYPLDETKWVVEKRWQYKDGENWKEYSTSYSGLINLSKMQNREVVIIKPIEK